MDYQSNKELMDKFAEQDGHFAGIHRRLDRQDGNFVEIRQHLVQHDANFVEIRQHLAHHGANFVEISQHLALHDQRFDNVEEAVHQLGIKFENSESNQKIILDVVLAIQDKFEKYENLDKQVQEHGHRIAAIEHVVSRHPD